MKNYHMLVVLCSIICGRSDKSRSAEEQVSPFNGPAEFLKLAYSVDKPITDKVLGGFAGHAYQLMYGMFLYPSLELAKSKKRKVKFLEIGLGCDDRNSSADSARLWKKFFGDHGDIWIAEYDQVCVEETKKNGFLNGVNTLVGDQSNIEDLNRWIKTSGGDFDIIVDDGGHTNQQIYTSFLKLWPVLNPGGIYFMEDLQVGRVRQWNNDSTTAVMIDIINSWSDQLIISHWRGSVFTSQMKAFRQNYPIPKNMKWIFCQKQACVFGKCDIKDPAGCRPY
eukprot:gene2578-5035_t